MDEKKIKQFSSLLWSDFLNSLWADLSKENIDRWASDVEVVSFDACNIYLKVMDPFQFEWICSHILPIAKKRLIGNNGKPITVHLCMEELTSTRTLSYQISTFDSDPIKPHCKLHHFITTEKNRISLEIFKTLLKPKKSTTYNPIYLYGPSGSGKTHLLMGAIDDFNKSGLNTIFVSGETFTKHVVSAIKSDNFKGFRNKYRSTDILVIDGIEELGRKSTTQEEFFHTFNTLHSEGKQILISSRVIPKYLESMEDRIVSRLEWGITIKLNRSNKISNKIIDLFTKVYNIDYDAEVKSYLLKYFNSPKKLESTLEILKQYKNTSLRKAEKLLSNSIAPKETPSINKIIEGVASKFDIKKEAILGKSQHHDISLSRQVSMFLLREKLNLTYMKIGTIFKRDHSTVMSSINKINKRIEEDDTEISKYISHMKL